MPKATRRPPSTRHGKTAPPGPPSPPTGESERLAILAEKVVAYLEDGLKVALGTQGNEEIVSKTLSQIERALATLQSARGGLGTRSPHPGMDRDSWQPD